MSRPQSRVEWPTVALAAACYAGWAVATTVAAQIWLPLGLSLTAVFIALHSSLQHEALHGHPFRHARANAALVFPALGVFVPYGRFRETHLAHHHDPALTDPYDDPESNFLHPARWAALPRPVKALLRFNNTLAGRMLVGPAISMAVFLRDDLRAILSGNHRIGRAWLAHVAGLVPVAAWLGTVGALPLWGYLVAAYAGMSILKIRTFLEHRAAEDAGHRTVIIEDKGPLALLFLNNNLHVVHHTHPGVPWYRLPALYAADRARYLARNGGYRYRSYLEVMRRHLLRAKDPVPHPLRGGASEDPAEL